MSAGEQITMLGSQKSSTQGYLKPCAPRTETPSSWARVKSLEKIYEIWVAQREQKLLIYLPLNELPWLFHGSIMLQKFMVRFYNINSWRYIRILYGFYSSFSLSADCRKHLKHEENNVMSKRWSVFWSTKRTLFQARQNCPSWYSCQEIREDLLYGRRHVLAYIIWSYAMLLFLKQISSDMAVMLVFMEQYVHYNTKTLNPWWARSIPEVILITTWD